MKSLVVTVVIISTLFLVIHGTSEAEPTHPNEVGLYTTNDGAGATGTYIIGAPVDVFLVLTKPEDVGNGGAQFNVITGLELSLHFSPVPNNDLLLLDTVITPGCVDIGLSKDINSGILDFIVGIPDNEALSVVNEAAALIQLTFMNFSPHTTEVSLHPNSDRQSVPGEMAFLGGMIPEPPYSLLAMYSIGGDPNASVFEFNGEAVVVEGSSFGSVKALFR